jgi:hypothetical protein
VSLLNNAIITSMRGVLSHRAHSLAPAHQTETTATHQLQQGELAEFIDYQSFTQDTQDREDHSFCGVYFDLSPSDELPLSYVEVTSLWVRGDLGPCTIWTTPDGHGGVRGGKVYDQDAWRCVYEREHGPSFDEFVEVRLLIIFIFVWEISMTGRYFLLNRCPWTNPSGWNEVKKRASTSTANSRAIAAWCTTTSGTARRVWWTTGGWSSGPRWRT